jgi:hypothetical protein
MKLIPTLVATCALLLPRAVSAESFQGKVSMTMTTSNGSKESSQTITYVMKEGFMKIEMGSAKGQMSSIVDFKNRQMIMIMDQQKMYMVQALPQPTVDQKDAAAAKQLGADVQVTSEKATILGYECTKIISTTPQGTAEVWVTDQLGSFMGISPGGGGGPGRRPQAPQAWESALKGKNFFPLRVVSNVPGKGTFRLDVTSVDKMPIADSEFAPPDGYRKLDMGSMLGGALPGLMPGARPSGNN